MTVSFLRVYANGEKQFVGLTQSEICYYYVFIYGETGCQSRKHKKRMLIYILYSSHTCSAVFVCVVAYAVTFLVDPVSFSCFLGIPEIKP